MLEHVKRCLPEEACGLIGGIEDRGSIVIPIANRLNSPVRFLMEPGEQVNAFIWLEKNHLDLIAIFHSHPYGPSFPSPTDILEFYYPGVVTLIWNRPRKNWRCNAFQIESGIYSEMGIHWGLNT